MNTSKDVPWFKPDILEINPVFRRLLEDYSKIAPELVKSHVFAVRSKAWETFPYPCIGQFSFLTLSIGIHPCYSRVLSVLKAIDSQATLLDLGCCFAQDIRTLVYDGAPSDRLAACDVEYAFIDLGYELFADRETLKTHFFAADIFDANGNLMGFEGNYDFIHVGSFLHLFNQEDQFKACKNIVKLLKPRGGSTVFGRQMGNVEAMSVANMIQGGIMWQHDPQSFEQMWQTVGEETGTDWKVTAELDQGEGMDQSHWTSAGCRRLKFEVTRLS